MKLFDNIRAWLGREPEPHEIERLDRRAFLCGMAVTTAGLLVPLPTILVPKSIDAADIVFGPCGPPERMYLCSGPNGEYGFFSFEFDRP